MGPRVAGPCQSVAVGRFAKKLFDPALLGRGGQAFFQAPMFHK